MKIVDMIERISYAQGVLSVLDPDDSHCAVKELETVIQELKKQVDQNGFIQD